MAAILSRPQSVKRNTQQSALENPNCMEAMYSLDKTSPKIFGDQ